MSFKLQENISKILFNAFFFIPLFTILGPFFPDLIISITIIFTFIFILPSAKEIFLNEKKIDYFTLIFFLFFIFILLSSTINFFINGEINFENFKKYFLRSLFLFRFVFYPISIIYIAKKFNLMVGKKNIIIFLITIFFVIFDTLFQYFNGKDIFGFIPMERGQLSIGRLSGPFGDELIPGSYLMRYFFITILFLFFFIKKKFYFNIAFSIYLILCLTTIVLTGERSVTLLTCFGILIFFILFKQQRKIIISGVIVFSLIIFYILEKNPILKQRVINHSLHQFGISLEKEDNKKHFKEIKSFSDSHYGAHWQTAYEIWKKNKFIGIGLKQFRYECSDKIYENISSRLKGIRCATHPHNTYFEVISETGLIGLIFFLLLLSTLLIKIYKIKNYDKSIKFTMISVILLFWPVITTGSFFTNMTQIYFSFLLTIIFMIENQLFNKFKKIK
tara:strand:- start:359 stop:1699 length:1341 start_codon:yes stop_codon:yes gene_type:complete